MATKQDFLKLNEEVFDFFNSDKNRSIFSGSPKNLTVYDIQYLIYRHFGEKEGTHKNAISNKLRKYIEIIDEEELT